MSDIDKGKDDLLALRQGTLYIADFLNDIYEAIGQKNFKKPMIGFCHYHN